jgi:hypothetical protein
MACSETYRAKGNTMQVPSMLQGESLKRLLQGAPAGARRNPMKRLSVMGTAALALVLGMAAAQATPRIHPAQASDLTAARGAAAATPVSGASAGAISVDCVAKKKKTR